MPQFVNVDAAVAVPVPADLDPELAAAAMLQGMTAHYLVNSTYTVQPGDSVLIHAAAGGVGQLLVQLAVARGARVIATAGTAAKRDKALELGAHVVLRYDEFETSEGLAAAIRDANGGAGVTVAYDGVGRATFDASLAALAVRGMLVLFGASSGQVPPFELQRLNYGGSLFVTRPTLAHYLRTRDELLFRAIVDLRVDRRRIAGDRRSAAGTRSRCGRRLRGARKPGQHGQAPADPLALVLSDYCHCRSLFQVPHFGRKSGHL